MTSARLDVPRFAAWIALAICVPFVLMIGGTLALVAWPGGRVLMQSLIVVTACIGVVLAARRPGLLRSPVVATGAVFVLAGLASAFVSQRPAASVEAAALLVLSAPCYLAIRALAWDGPLTTRIRWLTVVCAFFVLVPYVVQVLMAWLQWWGAVGFGLPPLRPGNAGGTTASPNALATYTYLLVPYAAWAAWSWPRGRAVVAVLLSCAGFALLTTGSRGAWLAAAVGLVVTGTMLVADRRRAGMTIHRKLLAGAVGVALVTLVMVGPWLVARLTAGDAGRFELWAAAASIFAKFPLLGGGPGSWQGLRLLEPITNSATAVLHTPHDIVLYIGAETGVVGIASAGLVLAAIVVAAVRAWTRDTNDRRVEVAIIVGSLVGLAVHALVDTQFHLAAVVAMTVFLVARLDGPIEPVSMPVTSRRRWPMAVVGTATIVAALILVRVDAAMLAAETATAATNRGEWARANETFDQAVSWHDLGAYEQGRAIALSRQGNVPAAIEALRRQVATDPLTAALAEIAVLLEPSDLVSAIEAAQAVARAGPYDPTATLNAAGVLDRASDPAAIQMTKGVILATPLFDLDPLPSGPVSPATWRAAIDLAIAELAESDPLAAANIALESGDRRRASELADAAPPGPDRILFEMYVAALDGSMPDMAAGREALRTRQSGLALVWFARLAKIADSSADLARVTTMIGTLGGGDPLTSTTVDLAGDSNRLDAGRFPTYPAAFSYRLGPLRPWVKGMTTLVPGPWRP